METMVNQILHCDAEQINHVINALTARHAELYPEWELVIFSMDKRKDRNEQIDQAAQLLKKVQ